MNALFKPTTTAALLGLLCSPAWAVDAQSVVDRLQDLLDKQGMKITYAGVEEDGSDVILKGVGVKVPGEDTSFPIGTITLFDVEDADDGGYRVGEMTLADMALSETGMAVLAEDMVIEGLLIPAEGGSPVFGDVLLYEKFGIGLISVKIDDKQVFALEDASANVDLPVSADQKMTFTGGIERLFADISAIDDPKTQQVMQALGYSQLEGRASFAGNWTPADGRMVLEENRITFDDVASIDFKADISGYTPQFITALQAMSRQMQEGGEQNQQAQGLAMLGLMQQLNFHSAAIRIDDASLTGRLLDFFAAQQGTDRQTMVNQTKGVLPFMLAQLGNPAFAAQITEAVSAYLDDPKSLEIRAEPAQPVPFAMLMATGMSAPQSLPDQLSVTVKANQ